MKKGFTLIELLAVIVILAIIAVIAVPIVLNIINDTKESALVRSADFYTEAIETSVASKLLKDTSFKIETGVYDVMNDGNICLGVYENNSCNGNKLEVEMDGEKPTGGTVLIHNSMVENSNLIYDNNIVSNQSTVLSNVPTPDECFETIKLNDVDVPASDEYWDGKYYGISNYLCGAGTDNEILDVVIPSEIDGIKIITIDGNSFSSKGLKSVVINDGILWINDSAFYDNQITNLILPNSVTRIGGFGKNELTSVVIPNSVTTIAWEAFYNNQLTSVIIPNSVYSIEERAFSENPITNLILQNGIREIYVDAFYDNELTSVVIPDSVTYLSGFKKNHLTNIEIPSSVTRLGPDAFYDNELTSVTIPSSVNEIVEGAFSKNQLTSVIIKGKSSPSDFDEFYTPIFGWAEGYSDANIIWEP